MGPVGFKGLLVVHLILQLGWGTVPLKGNPTGSVDGSDSPSLCPWDSACKKIAECDSGYYMTADMQAFHCGPSRDVESMVCCFIPSLQNNVEETRNKNETSGTDELDTSAARVVVNGDLDDEIKIDVIPPELTDVPMNIQQEGEDHHRFHHVQSHEDAVDHTEEQQTVHRNYAQDVHGNPLPLPDLPQDTYHQNTPQDAGRHSGRARNPNDPLDSEIFEDLYRQESYRRQPSHPDQFQYENRRFEFQNAYQQRDPRDPQEPQHRMREDETEASFHQQDYSNNDWRRDRFPPRREHWQQTHQAVPNNNECLCERGERGPPGPKGEPGKVIYIPVFVHPNGQPVNQDNNIGNAPPSHFPPGHGGPSHPHPTQFGQEYLDRAYQAYQYSFPSHQQDIPPYVAHPSPTFVNYAVPVPPVMPPSQQHRQVHHPNSFPQGHPTNSQFTLGQPYILPITTVRQKRFEMH